MGAPGPAKSIQEAVSFHQQGRLGEAEKIYLSVLDAQPDNFDALHFLGILRAQQGDGDAAARLIDHALKRNPLSADAHSNLGNVLQQLGRHDEAIASYDRALSISPDSPGVHYNRGNALRALGRCDEAIASYDRALALRPDYAEAHNNRGNILQELQRHEEAAASYERCLAITPDDAAVLSNLGSVLHRLNRYDDALACCDRALAIDPGHARAHNNRGNALLELKRPEAALASYERAVEIEPVYVEALNNLGNVLLHLNRFEEALTSYDRAIWLQPDYVDAINGYGNALHRLKRYDEALIRYDRALEIQPGSVEALISRGNTLLDLGRPLEALESCDRALELKPDNPEALYNRGIALERLARPDGALASYDRALAIKPDYPEALNNRGVALMKLGRLEDALESYDRALAIKPDSPEALNNRGNALLKFKRLEEALACYDRALQLRPDYADPFLNRGVALRGLRRHEEAVRSYARLLEIAPEFEYAPGELVFSRLNCCDWAEYDESVARIVGKVRAGRRAATPFVFASLADSAADQLNCSRIFAADKFPAAARPLWRGERYRHHRIRLAYLSADFRIHPSSYLLAGMFEHHDRRRFETIAISFGENDRSGIRARLEGAFEHFIDVRDRSDSEVARLLRECEVDIAVDLTGHTQDGRMGILALRPAPVQVNFFCPGTSGADYLDYIICDRIVIPEEHHVHYSEKVVYLPGTFQANDSKRRISEHTPSRSEMGLPDEEFVFCSFNNSYKFNPAMFDVWMRVLRHVEGSVLWLQQVNATAATNLRREAIQRGIDTNRLVFASRILRLEDHLARYRLADLFLDTIPYNAQSTASDALWAGLPVLTCLGTTFVGRVAASLLNAIGLPELATHSLPEYEALALELATERQMLKNIKARLARNRDSYPLFDTDRFRRHIEAIYVEMRARAERGASPASFAVQL